MIFISFVHEDGDVAGAVQRLLATELALQGKVFLSSDRALVRAGDVWLEKVTGALSSARIAILLFSARSIGRPWVNFEAGGAWLTKKVIIPCCFGRMRKDRLPHPYSALQGIDLPEDAEYLVQSVHDHAALDIPRPTSLLVRGIAEMFTPPSKDAPAELWKKVADPYVGLRQVLKGFRDEPGAR